MKGKNSMKDKTGQGEISLKTKPPRHMNQAPKASWLPHEASELQHVRELDWFPLLDKDQTRQDKWCTFRVDFISLGLQPTKVLRKQRERGKGSHKVVGGETGGRGERERERRKKKLPPCAPLQWFVANRSGFGGNLKKISDSRVVEGEKPSGCNKEGCLRPYIPPRPSWWTPFQSRKREKA